MTQDTKRALALIFGGLLFFGIIVWIGSETQGNSAGAGAGLSALINSTINRLPDNPSTAQMIDWSAKCKAGQASSDDCNRLNGMISAKIDACRARMGIRDFVSVAGKPPEQLLFYCDQRFPDMR